MTARPRRTRAVAAAAAGAALLAAAGAWSASAATTGATPTENPAAVQQAASPGTSESLSSAEFTKCLAANGAPGIVIDGPVGSGTQSADQFPAPTEAGVKALDRAFEACAPGLSVEPVGEVGPGMLIPAEQERALQDCLRSAGVDYAAGSTNAFMVDGQEQFGAVESCLQGLAGDVTATAPGSGSS